MSFIKEQTYVIEYRVKYTDYSEYLYIVADSFEDAIKKFRECRGEDIIYKIEKGIEITRKIN